MNKEWERYKSFNNFPQDSAATPLRLAQSGFYYSGSGENAICFCCGLSNDKWTNNEAVHQHHRRLSPECRFVTGEHTTNVPIHGNTLNTQVKVSNTTDKSSNSEEILSCNNAAQQARREVGRRPTPDVQNTAGANESTNYVSRLCVSGGRTDHTQAESQRQFVSGANGHIEYYPGISYKKPKHPDYAIKSVRLASFENWPSGVVDPLQLAEAGFYYAGAPDCVRCFFCGGGMRNWEHGDNSWIEHARWFPNCDYVKQCKGEDFINMCRMANTDPLSSDNLIQNQVLQGWNPEEEHMVEDQLIEDLNSSAARIIMGMGYSQKHVENAVTFAREKYGASELRAQYLLEYLLDNSYSRTTDTLIEDTSEAASSGSNNQRTCTSSTTGAGASGSARLSEKESRSANSQICNYVTGKGATDEQQILLEENRQLRDQMTCKICMDKDACIVFLPCGHMVSCVECAHALRKCAVCRTLIQGTVKAYPA